jgi:hypothetical protein
MPGPAATRPAPEFPEGRRLALVVATTTYADTSLRQLRAPARDVADLTRVLADPDIGGFTVTSVIDGPAQQIRLAIEEFLADRRPDDLMLVYLSCHGLVDLRRRLYFAGTDTLKGRLAATGVESQWLLDQLEDCRARRQVVILDCCFSGAFAERAKGDSDLGLSERFHGEGRGRVVLTASRASEYSFEGELVPGSAMPGSVFTSALLRGIQSGDADIDNDGFISVDDAYGYAFDQIKAADAAQTPQRWLYGAEGDIYLARSPAGISVTPATLPESLRDSLESAHPQIRLGAVGALGDWLTEDNPERVLAARQALQQIVDNDIPRVAEPAQRLLDEGASTRVETTGTASGEVAGPPASSRPGGPRPRWLAYVAAAAILACLTVVTIVVLSHRQDASPAAGTGTAANRSGDITDPSPWRLSLKDAIQGLDTGCTVSVTNRGTQETWSQKDFYGSATFQMRPGSFHWEANDAGCLVRHRAGSGNLTLPFAQQATGGDSDAFVAGKNLSVTLKDLNGNSSCKVTLFDVKSGQVQDFQTLSQEAPSQSLDANGRSPVYLGDLQCSVEIASG